MITAADVKKLATRFIDATVNRIGTDEEAVCDVLKAARDNKATFESEVLAQLQNQPTDDWYVHDYDTQTSSMVVSSILNDEMSGAELFRAQDLYQEGVDQHRASRAQYLVNGLEKVIDCSDQSKSLALLGGAGLMIGLSLLVPPVFTVVGAVATFGTAIYGGVKIIDAGMTIAKADNDVVAKEAFQNLGEALAITAMAVPFVPRSWQITKAFAFKSEALSAEKLCVLKIKDIDVDFLQLVEKALAKIKYVTRDNAELGKLHVIVSRAATCSPSPEVQSFATTLLYQRWPSLAAGYPPFHPRAWPDFAPRSAPLTPESPAFVLGDNWPWIMAK